MLRVASVPGPALLAELCWELSLPMGRGSQETASCTLFVGAELEGSTSIQVLVREHATSLRARQIRIHSAHSADALRVLSSFRCCKGRLRDESALKQLEVGAIECRRGLPGGVVADWEWIQNQKEWRGEMDWQQALEWPTSEQSGQGLVFDTSRDDEDVLRHEFDLLDKDHNQHITLNELQMAADSEPDPDRADFLKVLSELLEENRVTHEKADIDFEDFKAAAEKIPRARGQRIEWTGRLGLDAALAQYLPYGGLFDQLKGIKEMTDYDLEIACNQFAQNDLFRIVKAGRDKLRVDSRPVLVSEAEKANQKFADAASGPVAVAKYGGLDEFIKGPEGLLGQPNPKLEEGMRREHCLRPSASELIVTPNYGVCTTSCWEWHWLLDPESTKNLPEDLKLRLRAQQPKGRYPGEVGDLLIESEVDFIISWVANLRAIDALVPKMTDEFKRHIQLKQHIQPERKDRSKELAQREALARGISVITQPTFNDTNGIEGKVALPIIQPEITVDQVRRIIAIAAGVSEDKVGVEIRSRRIRYCRFTESKALRDFLAAETDLQNLIEECEAEPDSEELVRKLRLRGSSENLALEAACAAMEEQTEKWKEQNTIRRQGRLRRPKLDLYFKFLSNDGDQRLFSKANLQKLEVLALSLYTGPLYILYNAVLRGFPKHLVELLNKGSTALNGSPSQPETVVGNR